MKERELSYLRQTEFWLHPIEPTFDLAHLQAIHKHLFQDVYSWAGRLRTIDISRDETLFAPHSRIEPYAQTVFAKLAAERHSIATVGLAGRLAHYLGEINAMHPFREGNGRTQPIFIDQVAKENGYTILWSRCSQQEMIAASVAAHHRDSNMLTDLIRRNLVTRIELLQSKVNSQELTPAAAVAEVERTISPLVIGSNSATHLRITQPLSFSAGFNIASPILASSRIGTVLDLALQRGVKPYDIARRIALCQSEMADRTRIKC